ncbi:hypothetical protein CHK_1410 [Christensenella hongkongensis]|uniref:Uncharacterized protein n=1 Tax=Christensenella hongkongensis TaxID=270498 RepID=A0A0M2NFU2_9FIRM|nr:hypothetical protein CHK_1410 [Christensenella hongkongensis]
MQHQFFKIDAFYTEKLRCLFFKSDYSYKKNGADCAAFFDIYDLPYRIPL